MELQLPMTAKDLAHHFGGHLIGEALREVRAVSALSVAGPGDLAFYQQRSLSGEVARLRGAVLLTTESLVHANDALTFVVVKNPQECFSRIAETFNWYPKGNGVDASARVDESAALGPGSSVGAFAYVGRRARIGARTRILEYAYVGDDVCIGDDCIVFPRAILNSRVEIGDRVRIFSGAVIGSDGFGFMQTETGLQTVPQVGTVVVESDVRIGANSTIDRATLGATRIGAGTKIDNLVHIAHNCQIGKHCIICAGTGLAGSVELEDYVVLGGQVGLGDHVHVGKGARIGSQGGTTTNLKGGQTYWGTPAIPVKESLRGFKFVQKLPEIWRRLARLEAGIGEEKHE